MTTRFRRFVPFALVLAVLPGCFDSYRALDSADGGRDAGPLVDAQLPDAQLPDASDGGADSGTPCPTGIEWLDPEPALRAMDMDVAPSLVASASGFELLYLVAGPNPCDGICPWLVRLPTSGASTVDLPGYWAYEVGTASYLAARVDENGQPSFAAVVGDELLWVGAPSIASWTIPEGRVTLDDTLGDVVFTAEREVIFETHRDATTVPYVEGSQVRVVTRTGAPVRTVDARSLFTMDFWSPRLGLGPDGNVWVGALRGPEPSATVLLANLGGWTLPGPASGCGTTTFELGPIAGATTYVIQDCGATSALSRRAGDTVMAAPVTTARQGDVASHVAAAGSRAAVAYRDTSGALTVAVIDGTRGIFFDLSSVLLGSSEVPGSGLSPHDATAGPIDIAAHADGTFAVVWTRTGLEYPEGAVQRFRLCE